ncbi:hypothetical protein INR49_025956 [Caranx melampygus]|nr:hypothetical protein INR49_025956 [Caranx melampygus]
MLPRPAAFQAPATALHAPAASIQTPALQSLASLLPPAAALRSPADLQTRVASLHTPTAALQTRAAALQTPVARQIWGLRIAVLRSRLYCNIPKLLSINRSELVALKISTIRRPPHVTLELFECRRLPVCRHLPQHIIHHFSNGLLLVCVDGLVHGMDRARPVLFHVFFNLSQPTAICGAVRKPERYWFSSGTGDSWSSDSAESAVSSPHVQVSVQPPARREAALTVAAAATNAATSVRYRPLLARIPQMTCWGQQDAFAVSRPDSCNPEQPKKKNQATMKIKRL